MDYMNTRVASFQKLSKKGNFGSLWIVVDSWKAIQFLHLIQPGLTGGRGCKVAELCAGSNSKGIQLCQSP